MICKKATTKLDSNCLLTTVYKYNYFFYQVFYIYTTKTFSFVKVLKAYETFKYFTFETKN